MIYLFWPTKFVPHWLEKVTAKKAGACFGEIHHDGFGVVVNRNNKLYAYAATGNFIKISHAEETVLSGGLGGVFFYGSFLSFIAGFAKDKK